MALDTKGCHGCGILTLSGTVYRKGEKEMCRACKCAQEATVRTPCGQNYCSMCGILIDQQGANYCSACTTLKNTFIRPEDYGKASAARCKCDFCSNDYSTSPPAHKFSKLELQFTPWKAPSEGSSQVPSEGSSCSKETVPATCQSEGLRENLVEEELRNKWEREQLSLKKKLVAQDSRAVKKILQAIQSKDTSKTFYIGGVDISFIKNNNVDACAALIIISFPQLKVVYKRLEMIQLTAPYIPGFLAFREVDSLISLYRSMLKNAPQYKPDVIFVDGNGRLHPRAFGLACHLGVLLDVPCVGVAKTLIHVDGIEDNADHKAKKQGLKNEGDTFPLTTNTGEVLGMALRGTRSAPNPIYVSLGHKISLLSAVTLVQKCCKYRIPEPTRFADLHSRQYLMDNKTDPEELIVREGENPPNEWQ